MTLKKQSKTFKKIQKYSVIPFLILNLASTASASNVSCVSLVKQGPTSSDFDRSRNYKYFGANHVNGATRFALWAPHAKSVEVMLEADGWKTGAHMLTFDAKRGVWEGNVPSLEKSNKLRYKYRIVDANNNVQFRNDPYARLIVRNDESGIWDSVVQNPKSYKWQTTNFKAPKKLRLMEVNPRTRVPGKQNVNFRELATHLVPILKESSINTVSLMPITHHNVVESWGYQPGGLFAVNYRHGSPDDLKFFVDQMHKNGIAVIFDVVLGHASKDWDTGLGGLDGEQIYFHKESYLGEHRDWGTYIYDFSRPEVQDFLISNVKYWADEFKIDGIRVDGVTSMLYLDYSRPEEEKALIWQRFFTNKNANAVEFLKRLNREIKQDYPQFISIAEESSGWGGVTHPVDQGGLGFDYMWGMGGMHHMRKFLKDAPSDRDLYTILAPNDWNENFIHYVNSHDETAHGKLRFIEQINGASGTEKKFDLARLVTMWMYVMRGSPMIFQGDEIAEVRGWNHNLEVQEQLRQYAPHAGFEKFMKELGRFHEKEGAFYRQDKESFKILNVDNTNKVLTLARTAKKPEDTLLIIMNFGDTTHRFYKVPALHKGNWEVVFDSDAGEYAGNGVIVEAVSKPGRPMNGFESSVGIRNLPAYSGLILKLK